VVHARRQARHRALHGAPGRYFRDLDGNKLNFFCMGKQG
jgi:hypothetical protein